MATVKDEKTNASIGKWFWTLSFLWFLAVLLAWFSTATRWWESEFNFFELVKKIDLEFWKNFGYFVGTLGVGPIAIYLATIRTSVATKQLETDRSKTGTDKEKMVNENFTTSVELLGNSAAAVRQGGIYALQRLLKNEKDLYSAIMRILTSFVRARSSVIKNIKTNNTFIDDKENASVIDLESAIFVIRERDSQTEDSYESKKLSQEIDRVGFLFDMSESSISNLDMNKADFRGFNLTDCNFNGCTFEEANFERSALVGTDFDDAVLTNAIFNGADISGNNPDNNDGSRLCKLNNVQGLTQDQINAAIGNKYTLLPTGLEPAPHWDMS